MKKGRFTAAYNSGYAVRAEYRPFPNCARQRFGQLLIRRELCPTLAALGGQWEWLLGECRYAKSYNTRVSAQREISCETSPMSPSHYEQA